MKDTVVGQECYRAGVMRGGRCGNTDPCLTPASGGEVQVSMQGFHLSLICVLVNCWKYIWTFIPDIWLEKGNLTFCLLKGKYLLCVQ